MKTQSEFLPLGVAKSFYTHTTHTGNLSENTNLSRDDAAAAWTISNRNDYY